LAVDVAVAGTGRHAKYVVMSGSARTDQYVQHDTTCISMAMLGNWRAGG
jgi:hypothetical protein